MADQCVVTVCDCQESKLIICHVLMAVKKKLKKKQLFEVTIFIDKLLPQCFLWFSVRSNFDRGVAICIPYAVLHIYLYTWMLSHLNTWFIEKGENDILLHSSSFSDLVTRWFVSQMIQM